MSSQETNYLGTSEQRFPELNHCQRRWKQEDEGGASEWEQYGQKYRQGHEGETKADRKTTTSYVASNIIIIYTSLKWSFHRLEEFFFQVKVEQMDLNP